MRATEKASDSLLLPEWIGQESRSRLLFTKMKVQAQKVQTPGFLEVTSKAGCETNIENRCTFAASLSQMVGGCMHPRVIGNAKTETGCHSPLRECFRCRTHRFRRRTLHSTGQNAFLAVPTALPLDVPKLDCLKD